MLIGSTENEGASVRVILSVDEEGQGSS